MSVKNFPRKDQFFRTTVSDRVLPAPTDSTPAAASPGSSPAPRPQDGRRMNLLLAELPSLVRDLSPAAFASAFSHSFSASPLSAAPSDVSPDAAWRFLGTWGRVLRLDSSLLPMPHVARPSHGTHDDSRYDLSRGFRDARESVDPLADAQALAEARGGELARALLDSGKLDGWAGCWIERAEALQRIAGESADGSEHEREREELAERLIDDLDEIQLICALARHYAAAEPDAPRNGNGHGSSAPASPAGGRGPADGRPSPAAAQRRRVLEADAQRCERWLSARADLFLAAGPFVRSVLSMMRPDLPAVAPYLARTALKYLTVLSAVEKMEDALTHARRAPLRLDLIPPA